MRKILSILLLFTMVATMLFSLPNISIKAEASTLSVSEQTKEDVYEHIAESVLNGQKEINVAKFNIPRSDAEILINAFVWENPEVSFCITNKSCASIDNVVQTITFDYDNLETIKTRHAEIVLAVDKIAAMIDTEWNDVQKAMWINDYICDTFTYDLETEYHTIDNLLKTKKGICEAYANLFTAVAKRVGLNSSYCFSNELAHIWNMVEIDGEWYYLDTTWNDSYVDRYNYFLLSETALRENISKTSPGVAYQLNSLHTARSTKYDNAFWRNCIYSSFAYDNNTVYYIKDFQLYSADLTTLETELIKNIEDSKWTTEEGYYTSGFHDLIKLGDNLYYNTATQIIKYSLIDKQESVIYNNDGKNIISMKFTYDGLEIGKNDDMNSDNVEFENITLPNIYRVQYIVNGGIRYIQYYSAGMTLKTPSNVKINGYKFDGWDYTDGFSVNTHLMINAKTIKVADSYTIKFLVDGREHATISLEYGDVIKLPDAPQKTADELNSYIFERWDGYTSGMTVTDNHVFNAVFSSQKRTYTIQFYKDATQLSEIKLEAGENIIYPEVSTTYTENGKTFNFVGWSSTSTTATKNETIYAIYAEEGKTYVVQYYCNGSLYKEFEVPSGTVLTYITDIPTREPTQTHAYEFTHWEGQDEGSFVLNDIKLVAQFNEVELDNKPTKSMFESYQLVILISLGSVLVLLVGIMVISSKKKNK